MSFNKLLISIKKRLLFYIFQYPRVIKYKLLSDYKIKGTYPIINQPTIISGVGTIKFGSDVHLGFRLSPYYYNGYGFINSRKQFSKVLIGDNVRINNNFNIVSEGEGISIGNNTLIGINVEITDSDFHELSPEKRLGGTPATKPVNIGKNVFIGSNVKILKGVSIGDNTIIGNGSIVSKSIPDNVIAAGNPCKVIKNIDIN